MNPLKCYYAAYSECWKLFRSAYEQAQAGPLPDDAWISIIEQAQAIGRQSPTARKIVIATLDAIEQIEKDGSPRN